MWGEEECLEDLGLVSISVMFSKDVTSVGLFKEGGNSGGAAVSE